MRQASRRGSLGGLPFELTGAQRARARRGRAPISVRTMPMVRLVQGDVGCGKTVVAAAAAARAVGSGLQAALMAPTELLAEQHCAHLHQLVRPLGVTRWRCSRAGSRHARGAARCGRRRGRGAQLVVGTHALFQEGIEFARLALVVVDEQHRFGVQQRLRLAEKATRRDGCRIS